jgi:ABC-type transport system substrate-binding protein
MWDEQVAAGTLPPVDDRLPMSPNVAPRSGIYGGVPAAPSRGASNISGNINLGGNRQTKMRLMEDFTLAPNLYKDVVYSNDFKTLTFYMRADCRMVSPTPPRTASSGGKMRS